MYMNNLHMEWLLHYQRCVFSVLELDGSKHASQCLSISHLWVLALITWELQVIDGHLACWTTALLSKTFLIWLRVVWKIRLESKGPRHASVVLWYNIIVCTYCKPVHTSLLGHNYAWQKTHVPYDCILHNKQQFYCQRRLATLHVAVSFQLIMYINIKITEVLLYFTNLLSSSKKGI